MGERQPLVIPPLLRDAARAVILSLAVGVIGMFFVLGTRQLYVEAAAVENLSFDDIVPTPVEIYHAWQQHESLLLEKHIPTTMWETLAGLSIAIVLGVVIAALMDFSRLLRWILYPILVVSQTIPIFAIAILLILVFGFGSGPKITVVVLFCRLALRAADGGDGAFGAGGFPPADPPGPAGGSAGADRRGRPQFDAGGGGADRRGPAGRRARAVHARALHDDRAGRARAADRDPGTVRAPAVAARRERQIAREAARRRGGPMGGRRDGGPATPPASAGNAPVLRRRCR